MISPRSEVSQCPVKELPHRTLTDNHHVHVEQVGEFFEGEDRRSQRLGEECTFLRRHEYRGESPGPRRWGYRSKKPC